MRLHCRALSSFATLPPTPPLLPISPVFFCGFFQPVKYLFTVAALYLLLGGARAPFGLRVPALAPRAADDADESKILVIRFENAVLYGFCVSFRPVRSLGFPVARSLRWPRFACLLLRSRRLILPRLPSRQWRRRVLRFSPSFFRLPSSLSFPFFLSGPLARLGSEEPFCVCCLSVWRASFV